MIGNMRSTVLGTTLMLLMVSRAMGGQEVLCGRPCKSDGYCTEFQIGRLTGDGCQLCKLDSDCGASRCTPECVHGFCDDTPDGPACTCMAGYGGADCSTMCPVECQPACELECGNGVCVSFEGRTVCHCQDGWTGSDCTTPVCSPPCMNGDCKEGEPNYCECPGWTGPGCITPVCDAGCENGVCVRPEDGDDFCTCYHGWTGADCTTRVCCPACDDNETCEEGEEGNVCVCKEGDNRGSRGSTSKAKKCKKAKKAKSASGSG